MRKQILLTVFTLSLTLTYTQNRPKDTINTGVINVVKPYSPTISDAFKVKESPSLADETTETKKDIQYNIFSFPVASTFTPAKGKAAGIEKAKPVKLYDNYASLGVGSYTSILGEVYLNEMISRTESFGGYLSHHSSQGGIEGVEFNDNFLDSKVNLNYSNKLRYMSWKADAGFQYQNYNWYGVAESFIDQAKTDNMKTSHAFYNAHVGGNITFEDTYINSGSILFRHFGDNQSSAENRLLLKGKVDVPINDEEIATEVVIDYVGGKFDRSYYDISELKYGNYQIGLSPSYQMTQDDFTINLGVSLFYMNDFEAKENKFYVYPNISASYRVANDVLVAYGGVKGDLIQNTYFDFANENPFVSPTLNVMPTDQLYNAFVGLKGKISNAMSYDISGHYLSDRNKALFINNDIISEPTQNYSYGNSFGIIYDDVDTFSFAGEIQVAVNRNFKLGVKGEYFSYSTNREAEAWNLPDLTASLFLDYQIDEHWFTGANVFYVGERKDQYFYNDPLIATTPFTVTLDSYFDVNAHAGYHVNDQLSIFLKVNNIANNAYQRWQNFQVQSFQLLAGATYKFDF
ncbi:TonB-dependent receptor [Gaetbulibacter saemankumensis]|uniref:TonB-dependent receptor n=1 Tax=Gaetbulibacter saemankumensis TaxID=311208 RepID=UPI0003FD9B01|nr:TonB-dependent receptor [Gaetbulibacter saemankumensis]